ncbi:MAG: hypothetical protein ACYDCQ_18075, partial [Dehalococcoidia bacterium]
MSLDLHRQAEDLMFEGDRLRAKREFAAAAHAYRRAAELESDTFELIPLEKQRTRGIISVSAVSLYRNAGMLAEGANDLILAQRLAHRYLGLSNLPDVAETQLQALIDECRHEANARAVGATLGSAGLSVILKGG